MYLSGYSLHFNWYTPLWLYASIFPSLRFRWFRFALVVLNAILMLVFLNNFVIVLVLLLWLYSPLLGLGHFFSFSILNTAGRTPWTADQPIVGPLPAYRTTQRLNKRTQYRHPCLEFLLYCWIYFGIHKCSYFYHFNRILYHRPLLKCNLQIIILFGCENFSLNYIVLFFGEYYKTALLTCLILSSQSSIRLFLCIFIYYLAIPIKWCVWSFCI
jgi:hypothetical protein